MEFIFIILNHSEYWKFRSTVLIIKYIITFSRVQIWRLFYIHLNPQSSKIIIKMLMTDFNESHNIYNYSYSMTFNVLWYLSEMCCFLDVTFVLLFYAFQSLYTTITIFKKENYFSFQIYIYKTITRTYSEVHSHIVNLYMRTYFYTVLITIFYSLMKLCTSWTDFWFLVFNSENQTNFTYFKHYILNFLPEESC